MKKAPYKRRTEQANPEVQKQRNKHCEARLASQMDRATRRFFQDRGLAMPSIGKTIHHMRSGEGLRRTISRLAQARAEAVALTTPGPDVGVGRTAPKMMGHDAPKS